MFYASTHKTLVNTVLSKHPKQTFSSQQCTQPHIYRDPIVIKARYLFVRTRSGDDDSDDNQLIDRLSALVRPCGFQGLSGYCSWITFLLRISGSSRSESLHIYKDICTLYIKIEIHTPPYIYIYIFFTYIHIYIYINLHLYIYI